MSDDILESFRQRFIYPSLRIAARLETEADEQRNAVRPGPSRIVRTHPLSVATDQELYEYYYRRSL